MAISSSLRPRMHPILGEPSVLEIIFPRQGEQCPVVELSYMGYSRPKCTCNDNQTHSSKFMILLEYLYEMDENVTHHFPLLEPSLTPSRMPKPSVRKHCFQTKGFVFENILLSFGKIYWITLRGELLGNSPKQSWASPT